MSTYGASVRTVIDAQRFVHDAVCVERRPHARTDCAVGQLPALAVADGLDYLAIRPNDPEGLRALMHLHVDETTDGALIVRCLTALARFRHREGL